VKSFSKSHINVLIQNDAVGDLQWRFTGFYGDPVRSKRNRCWELLEYMRKEYNNPWLCAGDFNEILHASKQSGGVERQEWKMEGFRDMIEAYRFEYLGFFGLPYTWDNKQQGARNIKVRLDRGLGDDKFVECLDNTVVNHIQCCESDHCALVIYVRKSEWIGHEK
jgi:endonuclease/exonuclease/phosphatase family metal-dependent hydrolase